MPTEDPSGILVYPKLDRGSDPRNPRGDSTPPPNVKGFPVKKTGKGRGPLIAGVVGALAIGAGAGHGLKPSKAGELAAARDDAKKAADAAKQHADDLDTQLTAAKADKQKDDDQLAALSSKAGDVDKKAAELDAAQKKLQGAI